MKTKLCVFLGILVVSGSFLSVVLLNNKKTSNTEPVIQQAEAPMVEKTEEPVEVEEPIVFDGLTEKELIAKINKSLNSDLEGKGNLFVKYSLENNVDPYLAVAISLHETGCKWECSQLVKKCNNVGGQVGKPSCNGGSYRSYKTLEEGIKGFIENISRNYIKKGLTTPEKMNSKYAASKTWASKVNKYIDEIKSK